MVDYEIISKNSVIRWSNRKDFVKNINGKKLNNIGLLTIHFNHFENTKTLLDGVYKLGLDIIIIENSTDDTEIEKLKKYVTGKKNITVINPISNIGSAGGYALGMEYILSEQYDYFFIVEDDVIFLENDTWNEILYKVDLHKLLFINNCKNTWSSKTPNDKGHSWYVQIAGYPTEFLKKIGIIDPRYFFRGEDLEWRVKIEGGMKKYNYERIIVDRNYIHPYLKPVNKNYSFVYFSIRNQLFSMKKDFKNFKGILVTIFFYLCSGLSKLILEGDSQLIKPVFLGIIDFLKFDYSYSNNLKNIGKYGKNGVKSDKYYNILDLRGVINHSYGNKHIMQLTGYDIEAIPEYSHNIFSIFYGIIISSNSTALSFLKSFSRNIINIEDVDIKTEKFQVRYCKKGLFKYIVGLLLFLPIIILSFLMYILICLIVLFSLILYRTN